MATYVILPGATVGGFYMRSVAEPLQQAGHNVFTPTYTGLGERSHLLSRDIDLETHILDVLQILKYEDLFDVILVGKSYSGMVITGVADRAPERIRHLVYLDAVVPQNGDCLLDLVGQDVADNVTTVVQTYGEGWLLPATSEIEPRVTNHPWKSFTQSLQLNGDPEAANVSRTYIYCSAKAPDHVMNDATRKGAQYAKDQRWGYYEIESGHEPEVERPDRVVDILLLLA